MATEPDEIPDRQGKCNAFRNGKKCGKGAGAGTNHLGTGRCSLHGGSTPTQVVAAQRTIAREQVQAFGLPRDIDPHEALIEELRRCAGWVAWLEQKVVSDGPDKLTDVVVGEEAAFTVPNPFKEMLDEERTRFERVANSCIKAGVEERRVRVIEQGAQFAAQAIRSVLASLGHDLEAPRVREAVTSALSVVPAA